MNVYTNTTLANKVKYRAPSMVISDMYKHHIDAALQHIASPAYVDVKEKYSLLFRFSVNLKWHTSECSLTQIHAFLRIRQTYWFHFLMGVWLNKWSIEFVPHREWNQLVNYCYTIRKSSLLIVSYTKYINTLFGKNVGFLNVKSDGTYRYHQALKV